MYAYKKILEKLLREKYSLLAELEKIALALDNGCTIIPGFAGPVHKDCPGMTILNPTQGDYLQCIVESIHSPNKKVCAPTPLSPRVSISCQKLGSSKGDNRVMMEKVVIQDERAISPDNEAPTVLYVRSEGSAPLLLYGDVGKKGFENVRKYAKEKKISLDDCGVSGRIALADMFPDRQS